MPCRNTVSAWSGVPLDAERVGQRGAALVGDRERPIPWHPLDPVRSEKAVQHGASEAAGQMVALLGPVHAVAHEWPFARWHFDTDVGEEVASGDGQLVFDVVAGAA